MCLAAYLRSSCPIPEIKWNKNAPAFYIEAVEKSSRVRRRFSVPYIYYIGSHEGCGCGFLKAGEVGTDLERCQENYKALGQAIREHMRLGATIEVFSCWEGEQASEPKSYAIMNTTILESPTFELKELEHIRFVDSDT